jgi:hypothetical protein
LNWKLKFSDKKVLTIIFVMTFLCYFISESILRQFVLNRSNTTTINLNSILEKLPSEIKEEVSRKIMIAELLDQLSMAKTKGRKVTILISLARARGDEELKRQYAEIIDKYPNEPESGTAFLFYLNAPGTSLKSISIDRFHEFIKNLREPELFYLFSQGYEKLKLNDSTYKDLFAYLYPVLKNKPKYREYKQLYTVLTDVAFELKNQPAELKARKLEEYCDSLPFYDKVLARKFKNKKNKKKSKK